MASILEGFGSRFGKVFCRFFGPKMHENCKSTLLAKTLKIVIFYLGKMHIFKKSNMKQKKNFEQKSTKNSMFLEASILTGFWEDFGKVLGGQNRRFSQLFRCFFDAKFRVQFGRAKNRKKSGQKHFWS